jgi:hypothetical protein
MRTKPSAKSLSLAMFSLLFALLLASCASTPTVDWNSRVGNYTLTQARTDLGPPSESHTLPDGGTSAEWLTRLGTAMPAASAGMDNGMRAGGVYQPGGISNGMGSKSEYVHLTFDVNGKLVKWERIYR